MLCHGSLSLSCFAKSDAKRFETRLSDVSLVLKNIFICFSLLNLVPLLGSLDESSDIDSVLLLLGEFEEFEYTSLRESCEGLRPRFLEFLELGVES